MPSSEMVFGEPNKRFDMPVLRANATIIDGYEAMRCRPVEIESAEKCDAPGV